MSVQAFPEKLSLASDVSFIGLIALSQFSCPFSHSVPVPNGRSKPQVQQYGPPHLHHTGGLIYVSSMVDYHSPRDGWFKRKDKHSKVVLLFHGE